MLVFPFLYSVEEELDVLQEILDKKLTECTLNDGVYTLVVHLDPETGEIEEDQFVYIDVQFSVDSDKYPHFPPSVYFKKWRGLKESHLILIKREIEEKMQSLIGSEMLYDVISDVREKLTALNKPHEDCAICQEGFEDKSEGRTIKTDCFHYFHVHCMSRWLDYVGSERDALKKEAEANRVKLKEDEVPQYECPVCRVPLTHYEEWIIQDDHLSKESREEVKVPISKELRQWQRKMAAIKKKQEDKGGIIDVEKQKRLLLIDPNWVRT